MTNKIKILTKIKDFNGVQKSLQDIELKLNLLRDSVNKPAEKELAETQGKTGDLNVERIIDDSYQMKIRTKKGWENPVLKPHYDSKWVAIANENHYTFSHNLGSKFLLIQVYVRDSNKNIFRIGSDSYQALGGDYESGISIFMKSNNTINIGTGNDAVFIHDNTLLGEVVSSNKIVTGDIRIFAWRIGINL